MKFFFDLMLTNEINNKDVSKSHQVIGSKVVKIFKLDLIFSCNDKIEIKFELHKIGVNLANCVLSKVITQSSIDISAT